MSARTSAVLVVALALGLLAACGAPDVASTTALVAEPSTTASTVPATTIGEAAEEDLEDEDFEGLTVAAVGDWFGDDPDEGSHVQDAIETRDGIIDAAPDLVLGLGDFSYEGHSPEGFFEFIRPLTSIVQIYPTYGNHDGIVDGVVTRPAFYGALRSFFPVSEEWYTFDRGPIHFVAWNSEYPEGSDSFGRQLDELSADLAAAYGDEEVEAIIMFVHRSMANPVSPGGPDLTLQEVVFPVIDEYSSKIAVVLQAHHHTYARTHAIRYSDQRDPSDCRNAEGGAIMCNAIHDIVDVGTGADPTVYSADGIVFVTVGTGGAYATGRIPDGPYIAARFSPVSTTESSPEAGSFGFLHLEIDSELEHLTGRYLANNGGVLDSFQVALDGP